MYFAEWCAHVHTEQLVSAVPISICNAFIFLKYSFLKNEYAVEIISDRMNPQFITVGGR